MKIFFLIIDLIGWNYEMKMRCLRTGGLLLALIPRSQFTGCNREVAGTPSALGFSMIV
jgi:hypothetical protein